MATQTDVQQIEHLARSVGRVRSEIAKVIIGQNDIIDQLLISLFARGHCLLVGVPGLAKTLLVRTVAQALDLSFSRVQFTPDLMPSDITGTEIIEDNMSTGHKQFRFVKGPIFANIVLADEINRTPPKTQAALLEAMQEHSVTVAGNSMKLPEPFFVMATQNPLEMEGTYPLPEAQLDRFLFKLLVKYPSAGDIETILDRTTDVNIAEATSVLDGPRINELSKLARQIPVAQEVKKYAIACVLASHPENEVAAPLVKRFVRYGASPRGAQALILTGKIKAILDGRFHVARDDIKSVAMAALRHRLILNFEGQAENVSADKVVEDVLKHAMGVSERALAA